MKTSCASIRQKSRVKPQPILTGVDTLRLVAPFDVPGKTTGLFVHYDGRQRHRNRLLWVNGQGQATYGVLALWRDENVQVRLSPTAVGSGADCWLSFSVPKVLYGSNARVCDRAGLQQALRLVQQITLNLGLSVDLQQARVSRLDVCRNTSLPRAIETYMALLNHLDIKYSRYSCNYPTGIRRGNKSSQLCVYDKRKELRFLAGGLHDDSWDDNQQAPGEEDLPPGSVLRYEWRLRNARTVRNKLGISTASDLCRHFNVLEDWLDSQLINNLFREELPESITDYKKPLTPLEMWQQIVAEAGGDPKAIDAVLRVVGYDCVAEQLGVSVWSELLKASYRNQKNRAAYSRLQASLRSARLLSFTHEGIPYGQLYLELKESALARYTNQLSDSLTPPSTETQKLRRPPRAA